MGSIYQIIIRIRILHEKHHREPSHRLFAITRHIFCTEISTPRLCQPSVSRPLLAMLSALLRLNTRSNNICAKQRLKLAADLLANVCQGWFVNLRHDINFDEMGSSSYIGLGFSLTELVAVCVDALQRTLSKNMDWNTLDIESPTYDGVL